MNNEIETTIDSLIYDLPETEREKARGILRVCKFPDANDPLLGLLRYLQLRQSCIGDKERPLAAGVARMAHELDNRIYAVKRIKLFWLATAFAGVFALGCILMGGFLAYGSRAYPTKMENLFGWTDPQMKRLQNDGVRLEVEDKQSLLLVTLHGDIVEGKIQKGNGETNGLAVIGIQSHP